MSTRHSLHTLLIALFLVVAPPAGNCTGNKLSLDEANTTVSELVDSVGPAFDCKIVVNTIKESSSAFQEVAHYFVSYEASGARCDVAHKVLSYRGGFKGLVFFKSMPPARGKNPCREPILDLIHEIDPPKER